MAPGRKKGASRTKTKNKLSLGDLVLAKVKGFPAWPAKISRPEDWDRTPDPRKYFVQFFGTAEIAFVAPAEIQEFTHETKNKLTARCKGRTKDFSRAVTEICEAFEELQGKSSGECMEENERTALADMDSSVDGGEDESKDKVDMVSMKNAGNPASGDEMCVLERCSHRQDATAVQDIKPDIPRDPMRSPGIPITKRSSCEDGAQSTIKVSMQKVDTTLSHGVGGGQVRGCDEMCSKLDKLESLSERSDTGTRNRISDNEGDPVSGLVDDQKDGFPPGYLPVHAKQHLDGGVEVFNSGEKSKKLVSGLVDDQKDEFPPGYLPLHAKQLDGGKLVTVAKTEGESTSEIQTEALASITSVKHDKSDGEPDLPCTVEHLKIGKEKRSVPRDAIKESASDILRPATDAGDKHKAKNLVKSEKHIKEGDKFGSSQNPSKKRVDKNGEREKNGSMVRVDNRNQKSQIKDRKHVLGTNEDLRPGKRPKHESVGTSTSKKSVAKSGKKESLSSVTAADSKIHKKTDDQKLSSRLEGENRLTSRMMGSAAETDLLGDGVVLPQTKRRRQVLGASVCVTEADKRLKEKSLSSRKNEAVRSDHGRSLVSHTNPRRRAVHLCDEDDDDECAAPVRGESKSISKHVNPSPSQKKDVDFMDEKTELGQSLPSKDGMSHAKTELITHNPSEIDEKRPKKTVDPSVNHTPRALESQKLSSEEEMPPLDLSQQSHGLVTGTKPVERKTINPQVRTSGTTPVKKSQTGPTKGSVVVPHSTVPSHNQGVTQNSGPTISAEKPKVTPKTSSRTSAAAFTEEYFTVLERLEAGREDTPPSISPLLTDSVTSMKHLIAVAQAKRKEAHSQSLSLENRTSVSFSSVQVVQGSLSPDSANLPLPFSTSSVMEKDAEEPNAQTSPMVHGQQFKLQQADGEDVDEVGLSSGHHAPRGSLSGGTEAAVARDAFEGMIETLSRTKESIGRATRLAIDCAKYGIASEVVELLIRKLESEASYHRRVDLFFLVDSITQCSHSQKGIAGASYIPTVQAALARLLGAAAPPGAGARENRRQCLKVLRLWLERKILPESLLRRYIDEIGGSSDDITSGLFLRRPSRAERAIDDPIREMEGMLVDEYGSNATFQLPGLLSSRVLEDEDLSGSLCNASGDESEVEAVNASEEQEACTVTPIDRRHQILEDVDGELEMEDVSGSMKDDKPMDGDGSLKLFSDPQSPNRIGESTSCSVPELLPLPIGSPPPPLDSPPLPPPLPCSPPPPPPPSSPLPLPPPPPPLLPSQPLPPSLPAPGPLPSLAPPHSLPSLHSQQSLPPQPLMPVHQAMNPQPPLPSPSTPLGYQPQMHHEYCRNPNGNQHTPMAGNTHPGHANVPLVNNEMFLTPSSSLVPAGHNEMYLTPQNPQPNQQYQAGNTPFPQRPYHQPPPAQTSTSYLTYNKPTAQHHMQQPFPHSYFPNGRRQYVDEPWKMASSDVNSDNQHAGWLGGGRNSGSRPPFHQEGFFRQPLERPPTNAMGFQHPVQNPRASAAPLSGHGVGHALPCKPDISARNSWRPT